MRKGKKGEPEVPRGQGDQGQRGTGTLRAQGSETNVSGAGKGEGIKVGPSLTPTTFPVPLLPTYKLCIRDSVGGEWASLSLESRSHELSSSSLRQREEMSGSLIKALGDTRSPAMFSPLHRAQEWPREDRVTLGPSRLERRRCWGDEGHLEAFIL